MFEKEFELLPQLQNHPRVDLGLTRTNIDPLAQHVEVSMVLRTRRELASYSSTASPCDTTDCWERVNTGANVRMDIRTVGFLAAEVYVDGQAIWRGWVETTLYPKDRDAAGEVITRAIPKLFESFPP